MKRLSQWCMRSRLVSLALKLLLTCLALRLAFRDVEPASFYGAWRYQDALLLTVSAALIMGQVILGGLRWRLILGALEGASKASLADIRPLQLCYISFFLGNCLPGMLGSDVVRVVMARSRHMPQGQVIHSVILDRLCALTALGVIVFLTLPRLSDMAGFDGLAIMPGLALLGLAGLWCMANLERLLARLDRYRLTRWLRRFTASARQLLTHIPAACGALAYALAAHASYCIAAWCLALSLSIQVTPLDCAVIIPLMLLLTTLPVSIGGWGVREVGLTGMLAWVGVAPAAALTLSVQLGLLGIVASLPGGVLWLLWRRHPDGGAHGKAT